MRIAMLVAGRRQVTVACDTVPAMEGARHLLFRTWTEANAMSDVKNPTRYTGVDRRAPRADPGLHKPGPIAGRHGAITTNLYNWHSYKNWAEKVRGSWDEKK
jgi:hypothetical protein